MSSAVAESVEGWSAPLLADADRWLDERGWWPSMAPRKLRELHEAETRRARSRSAGTISLLGGIVALGLYPALNDAVHDLHEQVVQLFVFGAVPFTILMSLFALLNPRPLLREWLLALPGLVFASMLTWLFTHTGLDATELYVAGMMLLMLFSAVTIQIRFGVAAILIAAMVVLFAVGIQVTHNEIPHFRRHLVTIDVVCAAYMLIANWRMHAQQQRGWAMGLRERLRRQDLFNRNQELDELVRRDALTGLANRRAYDAWLQNSWRQARGAGATLGMVLVDVDRFKAYNDFYGHPAGDACLQTIARCLREQLRGTTDHIARVGGEEFAVLLPGITASLCAEIAERLRLSIAGLELPHLGSGGDNIVTISCGAASLMAQDELGASDLVAAADAALYQAKESGRNLVCVADSPCPGMAFSTGG